MKIVFTDACYKKKEEKERKISFSLHQREWALLHFYSSMIIELNGKKSETKENAFILFRSGLQNVFRGKLEKCEYDYVRFMIEDEDGFFDFNLPLNKVFYIDEKDTIKSEINEIVFLLTERKEKSDDKMKNNFCAILKKLSESQVYSSKKDLVDSEKRYRLLTLRKEIKEKPEVWTVDLMAEHFFMTRCYFSVLYKKVFGISPAEDLRSFLNEKAKNLLLTTDLKIHKIAEILNYNECENFIRAFRKLNGFPPSVFRKQKKP